MVDHHFLSIPGQHSFSWVLISPIAPKTVWHIFANHIQVLAIAICKLSSQTIVAIMLTNIRPVIIENIAQFSYHGLFGKRCQEWLEWHKVPSKSPMPCPQAQQSYPWVGAGAARASIEDDHIKWRPWPSPYQEAKEFSLSDQDLGGADQAKWAPCLCLQGPRTFTWFSSSSISLKTSRPMPQTDFWSSLLLAHVGRQALKTGTVITGFMWYSMMSPGSVFYHSGCSREFRLYLDATLH